VGVGTRYYGLTQPFGPQSDDDPTPSNLVYLSHEQALADYAVLLTYIRQDAVSRLVAKSPQCAGALDPEDIPVISFGGSYGGMLTAWFRMKYPNIVDGAISASAPIAHFYGMTSNYSSTGYWQVVTADASSAGGSPDQCAVNVRASWQFLFSQGQVWP
jgi:lysosomal Pro-X carboxypeptidase